MEKLEYKIEIKASTQKVWDTMLTVETYEKWTAIAWPDSTFIGNWEKGSFMKFVSKDGSGTMAEIIDAKKYEFILAKHIAILLQGGVEDRESELTKDWIGINENYFFTEKGNHAELLVKIDTHPQWVSMFNDTWPLALETLKNICEN
jgi:hypothetical protein